MNHIANYHYGYPIYTGTKLELFKKLKSIVPNIGRLYLARAMKEMHLTKSHHPLVDLWACEKCDPLKIEEIRNYDTNVDRKIEDLLKTNIFIENLTKKHRTVINDLVENNKFDVAVEYMKSNGHELLKQETLLRINNLKKDIEIHHNAIIIQLYRIVSIIT